MYILKKKEKTNTIIVVVISTVTYKKDPLNIGLNPK